jgi:broad specificity phosphatase PhoE
VTLYLVRHAEVEPRKGVPAPEWHLTAAGHEAATLLAAAPAWRELTSIASSPEPKARGTADPIAVAAGLELRQEPDLREVRRGIPVVEREAYSALVERYLGEEPVLGWEPLELARTRIRSCVSRLVEEASGPLAVVSHGLVLSVYLRLGHAAWQRIPSPAVAVVDGERGTLVRPFLPRL